MTTALYILGYVTIGVIVALFFSWRGITKDVTSMLIVTYFWPAFMIWGFVETVIIGWPKKLYRKFNRKVKKWRK